MTDCVVRLKDGREFCAPLWSWRPTEGWFSLVGDDATGDNIIRLRDVESAVEKNQRVGILRDDDGNVVGPKMADVDLLARARADGWDGK